MIRTNEHGKVMRTIVCDGIQIEHEAETDTLLIDGVRVSAQVLKAITAQPEFQRRWLRFERDGEMVTVYQGEPYAG